ncbi:HlyD family efflux transporter periplasmic adaptor subunit [Psychrobacter sp. SWN149]|nr:HlyD family efflux transporter periplasmic adaptor subunit [Psychrobacter sp. SWN149]
MRTYINKRKSLCVFIALLLTACQPSPPKDVPSTIENEAIVETPLVITSESVTMTSEQILSIKPTRYQPSLGLQGHIEPIRQTSFVAAHPLKVEEVLVKKEQWVEKGTPLFIVKRLSAVDKTTNDSATVKTSTQKDLATNDSNDVTSNSPQKIGVNQNAAPDSDITAPKNTTADSKIILKPKTADADAARSIDDAKKSSPSFDLITVHASFSGRIENLYVKKDDQLDPRTTLLQLSDETKLHFMATLPIQAKPQLSVGQTVNFTTEGLSGQFTGQVSKLTATRQPKKLLVYVNVIDNEMSRDKLQPNMKVTGRINYGQIEVGTIVPKHALHDVDLTELQSPPYMPLSPLTANVWVIGQDQLLTRQPIEVVEYDPTTKQYLIAGVSNDSLICLADLPLDSKGKKVIVS